MGRTAEEDDLFALAAKGGTTEAKAKARVSVGPVFLEPEPDGRAGINQDGDDPGYTTRVKPPGPGSPRVSKRTETSSAGEKKVPGRPRGNAAERSIEEIGAAVEQKLNDFFAVIALGLPVTGTYGVENSDKAVKALMSIGKRRPKVLATLAKLADGADGMDIGRYVLGIAIAVQVDMQRMPYDMILAKATGVTDIVTEHFLDEEPAPNTNVTGQATYAAPRFQPVP